MASAYGQLRPRLQQRTQLSYIWRPEIPLKQSVFMWLLLNGLLPFPEILQTFGFSLPSKCLFCQNLDSLHHGFAECAQTRQLWNFFFTLFNLSVPDSYDLWDIFDFCWQNRDDHLHLVLRLLPPAVAGNYSAYVTPSCLMSKRPPLTDFVIRSCSNSMVTHSLFHYLLDQPPITS